MAASEADVAAHLLERLLAEPDFRARFRRDPAAACREAGLDQLADEMALGAGKAMMTLDVRESKSSLAGVLMAAAMEGVGLYQLSEHVFPHLDDVPAEVGDVLSRVHLPSIKGALAGGPDVPDTPVPEPKGAGGDATALADPPSKGSAAPPEAPAEPKAKPSAAPPEAPDPKPKPPAEPRGDASDAPPREAPPVETSPASNVDPSQLGAEGTGGAPTPETEALLSNDNVVFDQDGIADLKAGRIDPRVVAVLTKLSHEHKITVSCMCSDHPKFTTGGSVSNHHFGRGVDIAAIDGVPVNASNFDAREIANELQDLDTSIRPNEIGTPWAIAGPGYFTDAAHQNHLHIGFKEAITPGFMPPDDLTAPNDVGSSGGTAAKPGDTLSIPAAPKAKVAAVGTAPAKADTLSLPVAEPRSPGAVADQFAPRDYPGDNASKAELAAWMASEAKKRGLPPELPVMASLVESGLSNLNYGDRDSVGFFQMRTEIWNSGPYEGYPDDPGKQIDWFLDRAEAVKAKRLAAGQSIDDPNQYGDWVADVELPAEQYRGRYQLKLAEAQDLLKNAPDVPDTPVSAAPSVDVDPDQFGAEGTGGPPSPETRALLKNDNVVLDSDGIADLKAGRIDPRVVAVLTKLSHDHKITVSCMCSDHPKFTTGGSVSNHHLGRGVDIAAIDGVPVNASNFDAREIAMELQDLDSSIRPNEIGTPWAIAGPGYFTDAAHQNHLHIGFKQAITPDFKPPGDLAAAGDVPAATAPSASGGGSLGPAALKIALTQRGVHEIGSTNTGPQVDKFLAAAGVAPGNPWCASFITWSLEQAGHKMPGSGWAAVSTWVRNAEQGSNGLKIVSADEARPGDIVAYDWGGQSDFGADGHIGFLDSAVQGGKFTALEGNNADAVNVVPRQLGAGANIVFIRAEGDAAGGGPAVGGEAPAAVQKADTLTIPAAPERKVAAAGTAPAKADTLSLPVAEPQTAGPAADQFAPRDYPGDDASKAELAAWMASEAKKRGLPPQLPVMASLVESGLSNLNYGDRDSVGFFQMRTGTWNSGPYEGYADDPQKQIDWFLDQAEAAKAKRLAAGKSIDDPNQYGDWIADVENPATEFRGRYQLKLAEAQDLLKQAPATAPAPEDVLDAAAGGAGGGAAGAKALAAVAEAKKYLGTPYQWGGSTPQTNFDCSGLVQWSYAQAGISIPRVTYDQIDAPNGTPVQRDELLPGDLVFFADGGDVHHVGMSLGGDKFIHAPHTGDVVKISSLNESYYAQQFAGGRRFDAAGSAPAPDPTDVAKAQAHVAVDAAEVRRHDSLLFKAIQVQEARKSRSTVQFLKAIDPSQVQPTKDGAPAAPPELAAEAPPVAAAAPVDLAGVSHDYPGDHAPKAELARWLAKQAEKAGLPPELPVMASLVESGVQNLNYGDRDSVGFFQMRTEIWNSGPYAGYPERPELQAKWFIDNALAVKRKRIAAGDVNFGKDPSKWGDWIADVERPAEQYRGRYQLRLDEARSLLR